MTVGLLLHFSIGLFGKSRPHLCHIEQVCAVLRQRICQLSAFVGVLAIGVSVLHGAEKRWVTIPSSVSTIGTLGLTERYRPQIRSVRAMAGAIERYKEYAAECLRIAQDTTDDNQKVRLLEMAEAWQRLAEAASKRREPG